MKVKSYSADQYLIAVILLIAAILRFYRMPDLPFSFDEFSALFRTRFTNFSDLIEFGVVKTDTHPAGVQVFTWIWVGLFGTSPFAVKLPFVLMGIAAIWFTYLMGKEWYNPTVGLVAALFLAVLQYPVMHGQIARPYASGLFLSVWMIWTWWRTFYQDSEHQSKLKEIILYVIAGASCAYNHHFTLFILVLVGLSGLLLISKKNLNLYLLANVLIFFLYIPHLPIFFAQLNKGGVESWLSKPETDFFLKYVRYILHFEIAMYVAAILLLLVALLAPKEISGPSKKPFPRWILFVWLFITYSTAYFYSVYVNAVIQYSVLLFTFPFLIILIFSFSRNIRFYWKIGAFTFFAIVAIYSLINDRKHYDILYHSAYKDILTETERLTTEYGKRKATAVLKLPNDISRHYCKTLEIDSTIFRKLESFGSLIEFKKYVSRLNANTFIFGYSGLNVPEYLAIVKEYFPFPLLEKNWFTGDLFVFTKEKTNTIGDTDQLVWSTTKSLLNENGYALNCNDAEFIHLLTFRLDTVISHKNNMILMNLQVSKGNPEQAGIVCEIRKNDEIVMWREVLFNNFITSDSETYNVHAGIKVSDLSEKFLDGEVKCYIWSKGKEDFSIANFELNVWDGNPVIYSLFQKITD